MIDTILRKIILAQTALAQRTSGTNPSVPRTSGTNRSLQDIISDLTGFLVGLGVSIAVIIIIYAAYLMMTAGGNPEQFKKGKEAIFYVIVGLAVLLLSAAIVEIIKQLLGY